MKKIGALIVFFFAFFVAKGQDGTLDSTFGTYGNGYAWPMPLSLQANNPVGYAIGKQTGERIITAGSIKNGTYRDMLIIRANKKGILDTSFGDSGFVAVDFLGKDDEAKSIVVLDNDKILVGGSAATATDTIFALLKLNADGTIDSAFGLNGKLTIATNVGISNISVQSTGKIIARGGSTLIRLTADGSLDLSFGNNGVQNCQDGELMVIQKNDRIVVGGFNNNGVFLERYTNNGQLDLSFANNGIHSILNGRGTNSVYSLTTDSFDRIVYVGSSGFMGGLSYHIYGWVGRLLVNGLLDTTFNGSGFSSSISKYPEYPHKVLKVLIQPNQKMLLMDDGFTSRFYQNAGLDSSFHNYPQIAVGYNPYVGTGIAMLLNDSGIILLYKGSMGLAKLRTSPYNYVATKPTADFSVNAVIGQRNSTVFSFSDQSRDYPTTWRWSFYPSSVTYKDGTNASSQNPHVVFTQTGTYDVKLVVSNALGIDSVIKQSFVSVSDAPVANFGTNYRVNDTTTHFRFYDSSLYNPSNWKWTFSPEYFHFVESTSDTSRNPVVTFSVPGFYTVKLKVSNMYGIDSVIKSNYITVANPRRPMADFTQNETGGDTNDIFHFIDKSVYSPTSWLWTISPGTISYVNGTHSFSQNPDIRFDSAGIYSIQLTATNQYGADSIIKTDLIQVVFTGLAQIDNEVTLKVYPNPVTDYLYISSTTNQDLYGYSIYDMMGREMLAGRNTQHKFKVDISTLKEGNYILVVKANDKTMYKHIQVKK